MYLVYLDKENYFTGNYATKWDKELEQTGIEVETIPQEEEFYRLISYKLQDGAWEFDEERYQGLKAEETERILSGLKEKMIAESKSNLSRYLQENTVASSCHSGVEKQYSITPEKQSYLTAMILMSQMAVQAGIVYQPSWNATGEACEYNWTLPELQQLAMEIEAVVRPLVSRQQTIETQIRVTQTLEELQAIDISFVEVAADA